MGLIKKMIFFCVLVVLSAFACRQAQAQNSAEYIRYLVEQTSEKEMAENKIIRIVQGTDPVYLTFSADEKLCREKYGDEAEAVCGRSFRDVLPDAGQIQISPQTEGRWQWNSDSSLVFYPAGEWMPDTKFAVQFGKESLPKLTVITKPVQFVTQSLKPVLSAEFKFDPENPQKMVIAGSIAFNYRINRDSLESKLHIVPANPGAVSLGAMETSFHKNTLYFSVPVLKVNDRAETVKVQVVSGVQGMRSGKTASNYEYAVKIPARSEIFKLGGYAAGVEELPDMSAKQTVIAEFTLPVSPADIAARTEAVLLPREKVQTEETRKNPPYTWWSKAEITKDVLKNSEPLPLTLLTGGDEPARFLRFAPQKDIEAGRCAYVTVKAPIQGPDGFVIENDCTMLVQFKSLDSVIKIMQKGSVLSLHGDRKLSLYARNAKEIRYTVRQIRPEFINSYAALLKQSRYGQIHGSMLDSFSIVYEGKLPLAYMNAEKAQFASLDLNPFLQNKNKGLFHVTVEALKDDAVVGTDSRFIMLSDLGLIVKADEQEENVQAYVVSLSAGRPVFGAEVEVLGANGIALFSGKSDKQGLVRLPSLKGFEREKQVVAFVARFKDDLALLPYIDYRTDLRPKNTVDIYGKVFAEDILNGFIFTQRDIYRAGETAHFGFILKQGSMGAVSLENVPLLGTVYASSGQVVAKQKITLSKEGMGEFSCKIPDNAVSGVYNFYLEKADKTGLVASKNFHVMDFVPDTIKAELQNNMASGKKWYGKRDLQELAYTVNVQNLFGSPAINSTVRAKLLLVPFVFSFDGEYKDYTFYDPAKTDKTTTQEIGTFVTDENGRAVIKIDNTLLGRESCAVTLQAEIQDAQGGTALKLADVLHMSLVRSVVGYKTQSNLSFLTVGEQAALELIALDAFGRPHAKGELTAELYQSDFVKSLVKVEGKYQYTAVRRDKLLKKVPFVLNAQAAPFALDTSAVGGKLLVIKDKKERTVLQVRYTVVGDSTVQFDEHKTADLQVHMENKEYAGGETVKVAVKAPYEGAGLITIEREKVYAQKWFAADKGSSVQEIEIPQGLDGKAYLNVVYFRNIEDEDIFTEPCAMAVLPFTVDTAKRRLDLDLSIAGGAQDFVARPGEDIAVRVRTGEKAKVLVYAVDEGIVRLTDYRMPDPIKELFLDRALSVHTYQYLDMLMPEFGLMQKQLAKFGGDMLGAKMANAVRDAGLNPFKVKNRHQAVFWSGLMEVDGQGRELSVPVPDTFNGTLRVFAVACSETKVQAVQKDVLCQADIVVQPQLPLFVSPTDEFEASVQLTDMRRDKTHNYVEFAVTAGNAFEILRAEGAEKIASDAAGTELYGLTLGEKAQNIVRLRIKVKDTNEVLGEHTLLFAVREQQSGLLAAMPAAVSVRPASSLYTAVHFGRLPEKNGAFAQNIPLERSLYPQFASVSASVSAAPVPYVQALLQRIQAAAYPDTVQETAQAMPLLYLLEHTDYAPQQEDFSAEAMRSRIMDCLALLERRFTHGDVLYRWDNYGRLSLFELAFVMDFLTSAKEQGIYVAPYFFDNVINRMQQKLSAMPQSLEDARAMAYGAWCLTRNGIITSQIMANLTTWLQQNHKAWESDIAAVLMAGSMKLMMQDELAAALMEKYVPMGRDGWKCYEGFNGLSERALYLAVAAKQFPETADSEKLLKLREELYALLQEYFAKSSEALAVRSIVESGIGQDISDIQSHIAFADKAGNAVSDGVQAENSSLVRGIRIENAPAVANIGTIRIEAEKPLYYQASVSGYDKNRFAVQEKQAFAVTREFRDIDGYPLTAFRAGEEIVAVIKARSLTGRTENVLITDILSAAFEYSGAKSGGAAGLRTMQGKSSRDVLQEELEMQVEFADRQEDRLLLFAKLGGEESVFRYKVRVSGRGSFVLPDISVQSVENVLLTGRDTSAEQGRITAE